MFNDEQMIAMKLKGVCYCMSSPKPAPPPPPPPPEPVVQPKVDNTEAMQLRARRAASNTTFNRSTQDESGNTTLSGGLLGPQG